MIPTIPHYQAQLPTSAVEVAQPGTAVERFTTGTCFEWLHNKNVAYRANIRGEVNHAYNALLEQKGMLQAQIPGGENLELLGMNQDTVIVRPDLYMQAYRQVLVASLRVVDSMPLQISCGMFFDLLHDENVKHSANIRGLINQKYNQLLEQSHLPVSAIPGNDNLEILGQDRTTVVNSELYFQAFGVILGRYENPVPRAPSEISIHSLPEGLLGEIFAYLPAQDLARSAEVCRAWGIEASRDAQWNRLNPNPLPRDFYATHRSPIGVPRPNVENGITKGLFREIYRNTPLTQHEMTRRILDKSEKFLRRVEETLRISREETLAREERHRHTRPS